MRLLLLLLALFIGSLSYCPSSCACYYYNTFECSMCLQPFNRQFNSWNYTCDCVEGFMEMRPPQDSCRPSNCTTYNIQGCVSCATNWQLSYSEAAQIYVCVCKANYYFNNGSCDCLSLASPASYYESVIKHYCKLCPVGCQCDQTGCSHCESSIHRTILDEGGFNLCECESPYVQINGTCGVYDGCQITILSGAKRLSCNGSSLRHETAYNVWKCQSPYTDIDGVCVCAPPLLMGSYLIDSTQSICACSSKNYPTVYYEFMDTCNDCPLNCSCSNYGCYYCDNSTNREVLAGGCSCSAPYTEHMGKCICIEPYYLNTSQYNGTSCMCLNQLYPQEFHYDPQNGICISCPYGCTCSSQGCTSCLGYALRSIKLITWNWSTYYTCTSCHLTAVSQNGQCVCPLYSTFDNDTGACICDNTVSVYTNLDDTRRCVACPYYCNCSELEGCFECSSSQQREIKTVGGYSTCPCLTGYTDVSGVCTCNFPYQINFNNNYSCSCSEPYGIINGTCQCKSVSDTAHYYYDPLYKKCFLCPAGCTCDASGCSNCDPDALRYIVYYKGTNICPCVQSAFLKSGSCTYCSDNYNVVNLGCVYCSNCSSCDVLGCLTCNDDATLIAHNCVCKNLAFVNFNGKCSCGLGKYLNATVCTTCPKYCNTCVMNTTRNTVSCTSCKSGVSRINAVENSCPCETGYKEVSPVDTICCPTKCKTCNSTGCTNCSAASNRVLVGNDCVCNPTYVDQGNGMCGCSNSSTAYGGVCLNCPIHCAECGYNISSDTLYCTSCRPDVNRDIRDEVCKCLNGFVEATIERQFCIPLYCLAADENGTCLTCIFSRELSQDGSACVCGLYYYDTGLNGLCKVCSIVLEGCIDCNSSSECLICNETEGYLMVSTTNGSFCRQRLNTSSFVYAQSRQGISIQIRLTPRTANFSIPKSLTASLYTIYTSPPDNPDNGTVLNVSSFRRIGTNILEVSLTNPDARHEAQLIQIQYIMINYSDTASRRMLKDISGVDQKGVFYGVNESLFLQQQLIYSAGEMSMGTSWGYIVQSTFVGLFVAAALVLYVLGFKHNQISFFFQTLGMLAYTLHPDSFTVSMFLYPMKIASYQFGERSSLVSIPDGYLETSSGNFPYFSRDSNLFRVADLTLLIAIITTALIGVCRVVYCFRNTSRLTVSCIKKLTERTKKTVYRLLEFFYKTCMYPLLFFSVINLRNWNAQSMMELETFKRATLGLSIFLISVYSIVPFWQWFFETTARVNRIENVLEFFWASCATVILAFTIQSDLFQLLIVVFALRAGAYIFTRKRLLRDFLNYEYLKGITALLETITISLVKSGSSGAIGFFMFLTVSIQLTHEIIILVLTARKARIDKIKKDPVTEQVVDSSIFNFMESRTEAEPARQQPPEKQGGDLVVLVET